MKSIGPSHHGGAEDTEKCRGAVKARLSLAALEYTGNENQGIRGKRLGISFLIL
jgi:hypothetical protein